MADDDRTRIPRFDGTNFSNWKFRIETYLDEKDLLKYVEQDLSSISEGSAGQSSHTTREKKCRSIIIQYIADNQLEHVKDKKHAKDVFDTLKSVYERKSVASQLFLRKKLITMKYDEGTPIAGYFLEFDKTVRELKSIGGTVEPMDIVCYVVVVTRFIRHRRHNFGNIGAGSSNHRFREKSSVG